MEMTQQEFDKISKSYAQFTENLSQADIWALEAAILYTLVKKGFMPVEMFLEVVRVYKKYEEKY